MRLFNIPNQKAPFASSFRRIAIGAWAHPKHPAAYSFIELPVQNVQTYLTQIRKPDAPALSMTYFAAKVIAHLMVVYPELNRYVSRNTLIQRSSIDLFFPVTLKNKAGVDMSGICVRQADQKSIYQIASEVHHKTWRLRRGQDTDIRRVQSILYSLPVWMSKWVIGLMDFWGYTLNLNPKMLGGPKDRFGSALISSLGGFGLESTLVPLFPFSRTPISIGLGKVTGKVVPNGTELMVTPTLTVGITIDHRVMDGRHAGSAVRLAKKMFKSPETYSEIILG